MTESNPTPHSRIKATHVIIALLVIVALLQALVLINQGKRHIPLEKKQKTESLSAILPPTIPSRLYSKPHPAAAVSQLPAALPQQGYMGNDPFEEFDAVSRRMSNMMRSAFLMTAPLMQNIQQTVGQNLGADFSPAVDLQETDNAYIVRSDLPGLEKNKINLTVKNNVLTIEGVRQTSSETGDQNKGYYAQERSYGSFSRSLSLPGPVDESKIAAEYKNGVLTITLPKARESRTTQKVAIQ